MLRVLVLLSFSIIIKHNSLGQKFTLRGYVSNNVTGYIYVKYNDESNKEKVIVEGIKSGNFKIRGKINKITDAIISTDTTKLYKDKNHYRYLYIEPGKLSISFSDGNLQGARYRGIKTQNEYDSLKGEKKECEMLVKSLDSMIKKIRSDLLEGRINAADAEVELFRVREKRNPLLKQIMYKEIEFIKKKPGSYLSFTLIKDLVGYMSNDSIDYLYSRISEGIKGSNLDIVFLKYYTRYRAATSSEYPFDRILINKESPNFEIYNKSDTLSLASFRGKYLLLEFWGLGCLPCLRQNPVIESIRTKLNNDNLVVIGVNDDNKESTQKLLNYISKQKLEKWLHVNLKDILYFEENGLSVFNGEFDNYATIGVPRSVLIDDKGKVIYKSYGYEASNIKIISDLLEGRLNAKK